MNAAAAALVVLNGRQAFDPRASLFAHNEPGFWYDPSDVSSMYQDSAGTTPVTAVEQAVGLVLDKSRGYVLGGDLAVNGAFAADSDWTKGTGWSIGSGVATKTAGSAAALSQTITSTTGRAYLISATITRTAGTLTVSIGTSGTSAAFTASYTGTFVVFAGSSTQTLSFSGDASFAGTVDNVIVRELAGNHAIQPGATNRPILRSRYNRMTYSEAYDNAAFNISSAVTFSGGIATFGAAGYRYQVATVGVVQNVTYTLRAKLSSPTGKAVIGLRMANNTTGADGTYQQVALTATPTVYSITRTFTNAGTAIDCGLDNRSPYGDGVAGDVVVTEWDLRSSNDTYLPYQWINAATDYDTVGFPVYLAFDGSDDSLYTGGNLDLSGTDKLTVFAGLSRLGTADAMVAELTADATANNGTFYFGSPLAGGSWQYAFLSRGTTNGVATVTSGYSPPVTNVLTLQGDISGDSSTIRADGTQVGSATTNQGTGNYSSAVLNIGRRNNSSLPFNGRLYQLIGRGAATSAALLSQAERWVAGKQGRAL